MATIADLNYTDNMAAAKKPLLTDVRETLDSIETYVNDSLKDNLIQLTSDCFPTSYALDSDGAKNYTGFDLFDKQTAVDSYTGGDITIAATGAWTDVDATNASLAITPVMLAGDFAVTFQFMLSLLSSNATNEAHVRFRLTDSSENSTAVQTVREVSGVTGTRLVVPITLRHVFDAWSVAAKTVKLQYFIVTTTAMTILVNANSNEPIAMQVEKV